MSERSELFFPAEKHPAPLDGRNPGNRKSKA